MSSPGLMLDLRTGVSVLADSAPYEVTWQSDDADEGEHQIEVTATDSEGLEASDSATVTVDRTPPTVAIDKPGPNATVANSLSVEVSASDNAKVASVGLDADDGAVTQTLDDDPWSATLDVSGLGSGSHTLKATATDGAGLTGTASVSFEVDRSWTVELLATPQDDIIEDIALGPGGDLYVAGMTRGDLENNTNQGGVGDAFVARLDPLAQPKWIDLVSTSDADVAKAVTVTSGGAVFVAGESDASFLAKYGADGSRKWVHDINHGPLLEPRGIAADDASAVYVTGDTTEGQDTTTRKAFLGKYDGSGASAREEWFERLKPQSDDGRGRAVAVGPSGDVFVTGWVQSKIAGEQYAGGFSDVLVARYGSGGAQKWVSLIGGPANGGEYGRGITVSGSGDIYVSGHGSGDIEGRKNDSLMADAFLARFRSNGNDRWIRMVGVTEDAEANGIALDLSGM
ncbi:MAG: Ig-like domain-containing protein [Bradymonadaceae bacterium]